MKATNQNQSEATALQNDLTDRLEGYELELYRQIPETIDYVSHPSFELAATEAQLFGASAREVDVPDWLNYVDEPDDVYAHAKRSRHLSGPDERLLFMRYNYARYRLSLLIDAQRRRRSLSRAREMIKWYQRVRQVQSDLVNANLALVLAMARRTKVPGVDLTDLVSEGNMALLRSIDKFDASRGFKLSTYACRAILKSFNRLATRTGKYRSHFPVEYDPEREESDHDVMKHDLAEADLLDSLKTALDENSADLSDVELTIVKRRFGLETGKKQTLAVVAEHVGLTNERVRQVQLRALAKLRAQLKRMQNPPLARAG